MSDFKARMHQIQFPQTPLGELTALPRPQLNLTGPTSRGRAGNGRGKGRGEEERRREGENWEREAGEKGRGAYRDEGPLSPNENPKYRTPLTTH